MSLLLLSKGAARITKNSKFLAVTKLMFDLIYVNFVLMFLQVCHGPFLLLVTELSSVQSCLNIILNE